MVVVIQGTASAVMVVLALELPTAISAMIVSIAALGALHARCIIRTFMLTPGKIPVNLGIAGSMWGPPAT